MEGIFYPKSKQVLETEKEDELNEESFEFLNRPRNMRSQE